MGREGGSGNARTSAGAGRTHDLVDVGSSPTRPTRLALRAYPYEVQGQAPLEDERGVDTAQIRAILRLTPAERCAHMVEVANAMLSIRERAQAARS